MPESVNGDECRVTFLGVNNERGNFDLMLLDKEGNKYILNESKMPVTGINHMINWQTLMMSR